MRQLSNDFRSCTILKSPKDYAMLLQSLAVFFESTAQYNDQVGWRAALSVIALLNRIAAGGHCGKDLQYVRRSYEFISSPSG